MCFMRHIIQEKSYQQLIQWLEDNGFPKTKLTLANFSGMMAVEPIEAGEVIVAVPKKFLITNKSLADVYGTHTLSTHSLLALHLVLLRRDKMSWWRYYVDLLPLHFNTMPVNYPETLHPYFPNALLEQVIQQRVNIHQDFKAVSKYMETHSPPTQETMDPIHYDEYAWAWLCVNTRCIYMNATDTVTKEGNMALAPVLDFLNHTWDAKIESGFNRRTQCFEIKTLTPYAKGEQVFINYGPHDNMAILKEYGFVVPNNQFNYIHLDTEVWGLFNTMESPPGVKIKEEILENAGDYSMKKGDVSFRLWCALRLLALEGVGQPGFNHKVLAWHDVVMGQTERISLDNERRVMVMLESIVQQVKTTTIEKEASLKAMKSNPPPNVSPLALFFLTCLWEETKEITEAVLADIVKDMSLLR
ncbi:hypothetical protein BDF14DRAFT_1822524 [Spinellus fusiger]|nr:hypothetical protein BDF14DRAFT_1822524 [Spinellus fusiger]